MMPTEYPVVWYSYYTLHLFVMQVRALATSLDPAQLAVRSGDLGEIQAPCGHLSPSLFWPVFCTFETSLYLCSICGPLLGLVLFILLAGSVLVTSRSWEGFLDMLYIVLSLIYFR